MLNSSDFIQPEVSGKLNNIIEHEGTNFGDLVQISGLSKTEDFIGSDLSGVDFSDTDLRGFNFSNADLTGCRGINVKFDDTTILENAKVNGSFFALEQEKRLFLEADEEQRILFDSLKSQYWADGALWIGDNLKKSSKNFANASKIAKYLYNEVSDQSYKNQILYGLRGTFSDRKDYRDFLIHQISNPNLSYRSVRGILDILGRSFGKDPQAKSILFNFLQSENREIRKVCIPAVMSSIIYFDNKETIVDCMLSEADADLRKLYTRSFCTLLPPSASSLLYSHESKSFLDYKEEINSRRFEAMIRNAIYTKKLSEQADKVVKISKFVSDHTGGGITVSDTDVVLQSLEYDAALSSIAKLGLPLKLNYNSSEYEKSRKQLIRRIVG